MCACETNSYLKSIASGLVITFDAIIDASQTKASDNFSMNLNDKEATSKMVYYIFHIILLVTLLLIVNSIICYHFVKHGSKQ